MQEPSQSKKLELRISYLKNIQAPYETNHYYNLDSAQRDASITPRTDLWKPLHLSYW